MKLVVIFLACLFAHEINGLSDRLCGEKLTQIMWMVCENGFNGMMGKRSGDLQGTVINNEDEAISRKPSFSLANIFQIEPASQLAKTRRIRMMGIADECCKKSCSFNELAAYCD